MALYADELIGRANTVDPFSPINLPLRTGGSGFLTSIAVKQTAGNLDGFTVNLYCAGTAAEPNVKRSNSDTDIEDIPAVGGLGNKDIYKVMDTITVNSSGSLGTAFFPSGLGFMNAHNTSNERRSSRLFLSITPTTPAANKTFDVRILTRSPSSES